jgi:hypothetical protein
LSAVAITNAMPALDELRMRLRLATHWRPHDRLELIGAIGQGARDTPEITLAKGEETLGFVAIRWWL